MGKIIDWGTHMIGRTFLPGKVEQLKKNKEFFYILIDNDPIFYQQVRERLMGAGVKWGGIGSWPSHESCYYLRVYFADKGVWAIKGHDSQLIDTGKCVYSADHIVVPKPKEEISHDVVSCSSGLVAGGGLKFDGEKPRYDLLPWGAIDEVVKVLTVGASKYAPNNWQQVRGGRWRYFGAAARHLSAYARGEDADPETGLPHLAHAVCCLLFIISLDRGVDSTRLHDDEGGDA